MRRRPLLCTALAATFVVPVLAVVAFAGGGRGGGGATPVVTETDSMGPMQVPGIEIKNFGVVNGHIFRGNQPDEADYAALKRLGVSTVVDLRDDAMPFAKQAAEAAGLTYINIKMNDTDRPYDEQIAAFLKVVTDPAYGKCYVHCAGGRHRTGATIAVYRMAVQGWTAEEAYREMKAYDFYTRWGHGAYKTYVFDYYSRMKADPASVPMAFTPEVLGIAPTPFVAQP
jgi:protein tyrosine/serine phosphatase